MELPPSPAPAAQVHLALTQFLDGSPPGRFWVAQSKGVPPQALAYLVHFPRLVLLLAGQESMAIEHEGRARKIDLSPGDVVLIPANCWNRPLWLQPSTTLHFLFGRRQIGLSLVPNPTGGPLPPPGLKAVLPDASEEVPRRIMDALLSLRGEQPAVATPLVLALLRAVFAALPSESPAAATPRATGLYDSICMFIQEQFQFPLSRESVAAHFRVSPNHVSRLFKTSGQVSFNDYVNYVRLNRAKYLLKHHHQSLDEIATACGFSDTSYFCRVFKKMTRQTPSAYRRPPPSPTPPPQP